MKVMLVLYLLGAVLVFLVQLAPTESECPLAGWRDWLFAVAMSALWPVAFVAALAWGHDRDETDH